METRNLWIGLSFCLTFEGCLNGSGSNPDSVEMKGGMPENAYVDHTFEAEGLGKYDGRKVMIRIGGHEPLFFPRERTASGTTVISGGRFRVFFPSVSEVALYKPFILFIDANGDARCSVGLDVGFPGVIGSEAYVHHVEEWQLDSTTEADCEFYDSPWMD